MKKLIAILLVALMSFTLFAGCAADYSAADNWAVTRQLAPEAPGSAPMALPVEIPEMEMAWDDEFGFGGGALTDVQVDEAPFMPEVPVLPDAPPPESPNPPQTGAGDGFAERIIYTATATIETLEFDATIEAVYQMLAANGGFIEFSEVGGRSHWQIMQNQPSHRFASFTLRVPQERLAAITGGLEALGNVLTINNFAENITAQFVDTQARLSTLEVQEERLLHMLGRAEEVSDMIEIEQRLGEVRFQIESMVSTLRNWENRIRFSTLQLFIHEVHELTEPDDRNVPYWERVWNGLMNTFRNIGQFFMNLLMWIIVHLPTLIILAVVAVAVLLIVRMIARKHKKTKRDKPQKAYYPAYPNYQNQAGFPSNTNYPSNMNNPNNPSNPNDTSPPNNTSSTDNTDNENNKTN